MLHRLKVESVLEMHDVIIERYGGTQGVLNVGALDASLARPFCGYFLTPQAQAAALMHGLIKNHAFLDGNKRTAVVATLLSLDFSGFEVTTTRQFARIDDTAESVAANRLDLRQLEVYFRRRMKPKRPWSAHGAHQFADLFLS